MIVRARVTYTLKKSPTLYWKKKKNRSGFISQWRKGETNSKNSKRLRFSLAKYYQINQSNAL